MIKKYSPAFIIALLCFISSFGQTLSAGDIAFVSYNSDGIDNFSFVTLVEIPEGEIIFFTDNEEDDLNGGEGTITWTSPVGGVPCGTVVNITTTPTTTIGTVSESFNLDFTAAGDSIIAYQGSTASPSYLAALNNDLATGGIFGGANGTNLPIGLTNGVNALDVIEIDNIKYNSSLLNGTVNDIRNAINNFNNWSGNDTTNQTFTDTFTLSDCGVICTPTHSITSFSPSSGPANTQITITGSGFTGLSTVTIGEQTATIVSQSATELTVLLPDNATSGIITITESSCDTSALSNFTIITSNFNGCDGVVTPNELFISQITDATSGSLTYIELYNGTGGDLDLNDYTIQIRYNAGGFATTIPLSGTIVNGATYVASTTTIDPPCSNTIIGADGSLSNQTSSLSGINAGNNNSDCVSLYKNFTSNASPGTLIDVWGDCNDNNWMSTLGIGDEGFNFSRLTNASPPSITFNVADWNIVDWEDNACTDDDYSDIGVYTTANPPSISAINKTDTNCGAIAEITVVATEGFNGPGDAKELTYQWFGIAPGDTNWTQLSDGIIYTNTSTSVLNISNTLNLDGYQYYCEVRENDATCAVASEATTLTLTTATWDGNDWNWNDGTPQNTLPTLSSNVVINGNFSGGSISACNLIINNNSTLSVSNGFYVEVINDVTVNDGYITTNSKGSFVQRGDGTSAGSFTLNTNGIANVSKTTAVLNNTYDYTYWSSPVSGITVEQGLTDANVNRTYSFNANSFLDTDGDGVDDDGNAWELAARTDVMNPGQGFASMHGAFFFGTGVSYAYDFQGPYNTGDISFNVPYDTNNDDEHWNLIGNPYPSAIDANAFFTENAGILDGVLYMWSHVSPPSADNNGNEVLNFNQSDYITINTMSTAGNGTTDPPESRVPSGQSFFISSNASGSGLFTNTMRVSGNDTNNEFYRTTDASAVSNNDGVERLWLNLSSDVGIYSQISIGYADYATNGFDGNHIDTQRNYAGNAGFLYSTNNQGEGFYVIQGKALSSLNEYETIKIGFGALISTNETYTIEAVKWEGDFLSSNTIYLKDNLLNTLHDLSSSGYTFNSDGGIFDQRFELVFNQSALSTNTVDFDKNELTIVEVLDDKVEFSTNTNQRITSVLIYDLQGRLVYNLKGNSSKETYNLSNLNSQIYIAKVGFANGETVSKKALKK